jgi:hypothetical protein
LEDIIDGTVEKQTNFFEVLLAYTIYLLVKNPMGGMQGEAIFSKIEGGIFNASFFK